MANQQLIGQIEGAINSLTNIDIDTLNPNNVNFNPWNNLTFDDYKEALKDVIEVLEEVKASNILTNYSFNILNTLNQLVNNVVNQVNQFSAAPQQNNFQNSLNQIENLRTNMHSWGIYVNSKIGQNFEERIQNIDSEYQKIIAKRNEIDSLKDSLNKLLSPAVAGSLSKSFIERQGKLEKNRKLWFNAAIAFAIVAASATVWVVLSLINIFSIDIPESITHEQYQELLKKQPTNGSIQLLRIGILVPLYTIFGYVFSQYRKERNLEEEYAHRAAVSTALPNYGDLAVDPIVKDQIISSATNVIFTTPMDKAKAKSEGKYSLDEYKGIIDGISKAINQSDPK